MSCGEKLPKIGFPKQSSLDKSRNPIPDPSPATRSAESAQVVRAACGIPSINLIPSTACQWPQPTVTWRSPSCGSARPGPGPWGQLGHLTGPDAAAPAVCVEGSGPGLGSNPARSLLHLGRSFAVRHGDQRVRMCPGIAPPTGRSAAAGTRRRLQQTKFKMC